MVQSNRTSDVFAVADAWRRILATHGVVARPRPANDRTPVERNLSSLVAEYKIEAAAGVRRELARYRAVRRDDHMPVYIVVPHWRFADRFVNAAAFVDAARRSMRVHNRTIARIFGAGLLDDGRPYAVIARGGGDSLDRVVLRSGGLEWPMVRAIALRLCGAIESARAAGLAPRSIELEECVVAIEADELREVSFEDVLVDGRARLEEADVRAMAMLIHAMLGQRPRAAAIDNLVLRALGTLGFATIRDLTIAIAAINDRGEVVQHTGESHGANHAAHCGELTYDHDADDAAERVLSESARSREAARATEPSGNR